MRIFKILPFLVAVLLCACAKEISSDHGLSEVPIATTTAPISSDITTTELPETEAVTTTEEEIIPEEFDLQAEYYLACFESSKIHLIFSEAYTFDGENVIYTEREYFRNGETTVFISDNFFRIVITPESVLVINDADCTYNRFENDGTMMMPFEDKNYEFVSKEGNVETYTAQYNGGELLSVWTFNEDGTFKIEETVLEAGIKYLYSFTFVSDDVSQMQDSVAEDYTISEENQWEIM